MRNYILIAVKNVLRIYYGANKKFSYFQKIYLIINFKILEKFYSSLRVVVFFLTREKIDWTSFFSSTLRRNLCKSTLCSFTKPFYTATFIFLLINLSYLWVMVDWFFWLRKTKLLYREKSKIFLSLKKIEIKK